MTRNHNHLTIGEVARFIDSNHPHDCRLPSCGTCSMRKFMARAAFEASQRIEVSEMEILKAEKASD